MSKLPTITFPNAESKTANSRAVDTRQHHCFLIQEDRIPSAAATSPSRRLYLVVSANQRPSLLSLPTLITASAGVPARLKQVPHDTGETLPTSANDVSTLDEEKLCCDCRSGTPGGIPRVVTCGNAVKNGDQLSNLLLKEKKTTEEIPILLSVNK